MITRAVTGKTALKRLRNTATSCWKLRNFYFLVFLTPTPLNIWIKMVLSMKMDLLVHGHSVNLTHFWSKNIQWSLPRISSTFSVSCGQIQHHSSIDHLWPLFKVVSPMMKTTINGSIQLTLIPRPVTRMLIQLNSTNGLNMVNSWEDDLPTTPSTWTVNCTISPDMPKVGPDHFWVSSVLTYYLRLDCESTNC